MLAARLRAAICRRHATYMPTAPKNARTEICPIHTWFVTFPTTLSTAATVSSAIIPKRTRSRLIIRPSMATPVENWIDAWFRAWTEHDPAALDDAYVPGPVQRSAPFRDPIVPREYAAWAFSDEVAVEVWFAEPEGTACEWWAISTDTEGRTATLAGVSVLRLDETGKVVEQHDYWHVENGSRRPPPGWGPIRRHGSLDTRG